MKKCPFCKAEIEDNARFCLYCMKTLNEKEVILLPQKKKRWWLWIAAGMPALLLVGLLLILGGRKNPPARTGGEDAALAAGTVTTEGADNSAQAPQSPSGQAQNNTGRQPSGSENAPVQAETPAQKPSESASTTAPTPPTAPEKTTQATTPSAGTEQPTENTTAPEETQASTQPETQPVAAAYTYRAAQAGDDFSAMYTNSGGDIVITGISRQSADGVYRIPAYIDGKRVIAITANAFYGSGARKVYLSETVKTVWNYAFNGCPLTDLYFTQNVYIEAVAFSGNTASLTIHCPSGCQDRNLRTYSSSAASYGAVWEEWNG